MTILELVIETEDEGIGFAIDNDLLDISEVDDVILAEMLEEAKELLENINKYIASKVKEIKQEEICNDDDYAENWFN